MSLIVCAQPCSTSIIAGYTASPTKCIDASTIDIQFSTTRATGIGVPTGLPNGVSATWSNSKILIAGISTLAGQFNYSIPLVGSGCANKYAIGTITINATNTVGAASSYPLLALNSPIAPITHITSGASSIGLAVGLPAGLTAAWQNNVITITGTPIQLGVFNYEIPLQGGCGVVYAKATISSYPVWRGHGSDEWGNLYNWTPAVVPNYGATIVLDRYASNNLILDSNRTVGDINFNGSNRKIVLGNNNLTVSGNIFGADSSNYVRTNSGVLRRSIANQETFCYPVGNSSYNPVSIKNKTGVLDDFSVKVFDEVYTSGSGTGTIVNSPRVKRTWSINKQNSNAGTGVDFKFFWNTNEEVNLINPTLFHYQNGGWLSQPVIPNLTYDSINRSITYASYSGSFSTFAIGQANGALPVRWSSFTASRQHENILLKWTTTMEQNNSHFEVECSEDGLGFSTIARVNAALPGFNLNSYSYTDFNPPSSSAFYRIKQVDKDGTFSFSSVIKVDSDPLEKYKSWSNAQLGKLYVQVPQYLQEVALLLVYDASGKLIMKTQVLPGKNEINFRSTSGGYYFLQIVNSSKKLYATEFIYMPIK